MTRQPHEGPWFVYHDHGLSTREGGGFASYQEARDFACANGRRYVSNGTVLYFRGADSFWYQGGNA